MITINKYKAVKYSVATRLVLAPLDGVEIHTLLHKLPQWAELAEESDTLLHSLEHVVDFCVGCEAANAEADTGVCALVTVTEGAKNVRRLKRCRCAGGSGRQSDVLQSHQQGLALDVSEGYVDAASVTLVRVSVQGSVLHGEKTIGETLGQVGDALGIVLFIKSVHDLIKVFHDDSVCGGKGS
jgi:hypothetical protein